ncbi:MAG TPA: histidine phosphatase family protein [Epsilonproteobacteria bacterium]|nr:histidine phosphatase family protein [Campylobacterota bacterium]
MKQIILIRHAKVDIDNTIKIDAEALKKWVESYDIAPIVADSLPPEQTIILAKEADIVVSSTLRRAIDSAHVLGVKIEEQNALFNEAGIPEVNIPWLKLKAKTWLIVLRLMLLFGLGKKDVSLKASKKQASLAAERLVILSQEYENIVLVGHGGMNWLIAKALAKEGWVSNGKAVHSNWGVSILQKN